jgi:bacterioferritin
MKGHPEILARLNELFVYDLGAMELYLIQARLLQDWGYVRLHERIRHEADDEREHVEALIERIVFLGGVPDLSKRPLLTVGGSPKEMLEADLALELGVAKNLNEAIAICHREKDDGTRLVLEKLLHDTEMDHINWLETQLRLIQQLGIEAYLAEQIV